MDRAELDDTIVAISTPPGEGGIGIVRLSGPEAIKIAEAIFRAKNGKAASKFETYTMHYGHIIDTTQYAIRNTRYAIIDEVILTVMRAPKSYTKEDIVEINCHGGIQALKRVLELAMKYGARLAQPGEFTKRAFLNGRIDLTQAEAVLDVIRAKTEGSLKIAVGQLEGELSRSVNDVLEKAVSIAAEIEASIDFPEEGLELPDRQEFTRKIDNAIKQLELLVKSYDSGVVFREGVLAIICGKPNVGKSSLMNLLLKRDRVIVSPIPGTTRDAVEEVINLSGVPIRLVDTAGISDAGDALEKEGIKKSKSYLDMADIAILMLDASASLDGADREIIALIGNKKKIAVLNKIDIAKSADLRGMKKALGADGAIEISVKDRRNIDTLEKALHGAVLSGGYIQGESAVVSNARHKEALDSALRSMLSVKRAIEADFSPELAAIDLKEAIFNLGLVVGKSVSDDILDRIFGQFCIGK